MEERALALDDVPMVGLARRAQPFGGARDEVGDDGVDRDAGAGDEDAGLTGRAEIRLEATAAQLALDGERGIHLADRAIGADREEPLARALLAGTHLELARRVAHVGELAAVPLGQ